MNALIRLDGQGEATGGDVLLRLNLDHQMGHTLELGRDLCRLESEVLAGVKIECDPASTCQQPTTRGYPR